MLWIRVITVIPFDDGHFAQKLVEIISNSPYSSIIWYVVHIQSKGL